MQVNYLVSIIKSIGISRKSTYNLMKKIETFQFYFFKTLDNYSFILKSFNFKFVKEEFRGNRYSKLLSSAIIHEAKSRGFYKLYLKTDLVWYYEKFGAIFIEW